MAQHIRSFLSWLAGGWLILVLALGWQPVAQAHGSGTPQLVNVAAGPYQVWVWSMPEPVRVGEMHISLAVAQPEPAAPLDVEILLTPDDGASPPIRQSTVRQTRLFEEYYESDFILPTVGSWQANIAINGPAGAATSNFAFDVLPPHQVNWTLILWGGMAFAGLLGFLWIRRSGPRP